MTTTERITGATLNERWRVNANHALYRSDGTWYHQLREFPGALFDSNGYVLFNTPEELNRNPYLQIGKQITIPAGISSLPEYVKVADTIIDDRDTEEEDVYGDGSIYPYDSQEELHIQEQPETVFTWLRKLDKGKLVTNPEFQRNLVWKPDQKSQFIESILLNIPLPPLYVYQNGEGNYILVDGLQRTMTCREYINDEFALKDLHVLPNLNGCHFSQLNDLLQTRIEDKKFKVYVIKPSVPLPLVYDIFNRINTGGTKLTRQEVRNCIYIGEATRLLKRLASSNTFIRAIDSGVSAKRMKDQEVVLRYLAFRLLDYRTDYSGDMDAFLGKALKKMNQMSRDQLKRLERDFQRTMEKSFEFFGTRNFRLPTESTRGRINIALLESVACFFAEQDDSFLTRHKTQIIENFSELLNNESYRDAVRISTGDTKRVQRRFELANSILGNVT